MRSYWLLTFEKVVLQAKKMNVGGSWNLKLIEDKIREKIHERVGGSNLFEVRSLRMASWHPGSALTGKANLGSLDVFRMLTLHLSLTALESHTVRGSSK